VVLSLGSGYLLHAGVSQPLRDATRAARALAGGDLTSHIAADRGDDMGMLLQALQQMQANLVAMIGDVRVNVDIMSNATRGIAAGNRDLSARTEAHASSLEETASSMEQFSATVRQGPKTALGSFGELHPRSLRALGADGPLIAFEVILDRIPDTKAKPTRAKPMLELSAFQPVSRDFAFIVDRGVKAGDIVRAAQGVDKKLITDVSVFDVYEGKGIDADKKSVAIAVTIQPREKTLTDQEIDAVAAKIVAEVTKKTGGTLRA